MELPFAGHPTIGTACILAAMGEVSLEGGTAEVVFEVGVGPVRVQIRRVGGRLRAQFEVPSPATIGPPPPPKRDLARMLAIEERDILDGDSAPQSRSVGVPFVFVTVRDRSALERIRMNTSVWEDILSQHWAPHVYVITRDREADPTLARARMFAPAMGITEDPATGVAASALPGYLRTPDQVSGTFAWRIEQGFEMGRPSVIDVEADLRDGAVVRARVGGECVLVGRGELDLGE
jgi:trans-2,3-dihydro-3-hydroxyanthranilate isomerase